MGRLDTPNIQVVGKIKGPHGLKGLLRISSYTDPPVNLKNYIAVYISKDDGVSWGSLLVLDLRSNSRDFLGVLEGVTSREEALSLNGALVGVDRNAFVTLEEGEFYWSDLLGSAVENQEGIRFGILKQFIETGSNDVMEIERQGANLLIPFSSKYLSSIDPEKRLIIVDWEKEWN
tara:strand:- start:808 stop:1332 length:525 start_codon:yes stop_codon:yes gene_type:complete